MYTRVDGYRYVAATPPPHNQRMPNMHATLHTNTHPCADSNLDVKTNQNVSPILFYNSRLIMITFAVLDCLNNYVVYSANGILTFRDGSAITSVRTGTVGGPASNANW